MSSDKIVIVGGGIGGLATALALLHRGLDVEIHEQAPELKEVGAGIQISPNGNRALDSIGGGGWGPVVTTSLIGRGGATGPAAPPGAGSPLRALAGVPTSRSGRPAGSTRETRCAPQTRRVPARRPSGGSGSAVRLPAQPPGRPAAAIAEA